ncbi:acyl-CoA synthetase [Albimonas pacifica]|uniref:Acetyl-CoA synthetase n=1 Tax=Albimonas pacifica TaxID=1114924 RepID=A0A1I3BXS9_9RHOB|nr:AMP-binding protein [Albimonas pacifica]SFH67114.1 acetyl-CoA synthetase [Albimonas pacifica]
MVMIEGPTWEDVAARFAWRVPERYNAARDACDRHAGRANPALAVETPAGVIRHGYDELADMAARFAHLVQGQGLGRGDFVGVLAQPGLATPAATLGAWKAGAAICPMSTHFAPEALAFRLRAAGIGLLVADRENEARAREAVRLAGRPVRILVSDAGGSEADSLPAALAGLPSRFETADTRADDPLSLNFTSGTTGQPKGVVAPHSHLLGQVAAMEWLYDYPQAGEVIWSPAEWAWLAGHMCTLMTGLFLGMTVVARPRAGAFDPAETFRTLAEHGVNRVFLVPTMLKMMRQVPPALQRRGELQVRAVITGGEPCGAELYRWVEEVFGAPLNETFGQTECSTLLVNNQRRMTAPHGCLGRPVPGHVAAIVDDAGAPAPAGEIGQIAVRGPHPILFREYLGDPQATAEKWAGEWMLTGDLGRQDAQGFFWYVGRADDVITSSGYRIGPSEVEDALIAHPAVALAAVIGLPDPERTEIVAAFVRLAEGAAPSDALKEELRLFVRGRLARHEAPRRIEFVDDLPTTPTGKLMRKALRERMLAAERA